MKNSTMPWVCTQCGLDADDFGHESDVLSHFTTLGSRVYCFECAEDHSG